jgi:hypothetical protein
LSDKIFRWTYMTVVWSAGGPKLVLKPTSAELPSHMGLSPALVRFLGAAEVLAAVGVPSPQSASPFC